MPYEEPEDTKEEVVTKITASLRLNGFPEAQELEDFSNAAYLRIMIALGNVATARSLGLIK